MAEARIPVDLFNPGQVFACLGFLEAADILLGDAEGGFDWSDKTDVRFVLRAAEDSNPFEKVLGFLVDAKISALAPLGGNRTDQWGVETEINSEGVFPVSPTVRENGNRIWIKESALPIKLSSPSGFSISVSHWSDVENGRESIKTWGGAQGKSGASRMQDLLSAATLLLKTELAAASADPFQAASPVGGFRMNPRRDYVPMDIGFTLNAHKSTMDAMGHPLVEIMAVIGLENARPTLINRLTYKYCAWRGILDLALARPVLGCSMLATDVRTFTAELGEPNDYDRSIRNVKEEPTT